MLMESGARPGPQSWQNGLERFDGDFVIDTGLYVGVCVGPVPGILQGIELRDHQAASKSGFTGFRCIECRVGAGDQQAALIP